MTWKKFLIALLLASFSFGAGAYYRLDIIAPPPVPNNEHRNNQSNSSIAGAEAGQTQESATATQVAEEKLDITGRINILLFGEDNVEQSKRSDTVLFVAIDVEDRNIRVLSLPRDTRVSIPRHGMQKLNHAYAYGKEDLLRTTAENFLGTTIHYYVKIDYDNFPQLVDLLGGIDIYVPKAMKYRDVRGGLNIDIKAGQQRMNGETALKFVRFRKDALGDIGRIKRQQQFLKALLYRMYQPENLMRFPTIAEEIKNTLITDINPSMILQLCNFVRRMEKDSDRIFFTMLPGTDAKIDNLSYWISDRNQITAFLTANSEQLLAMEQASRERNRSNSINAITKANDFAPDTPDGKKPEVANSSPLSQEDVLKIVGNIPEAVAVLNGSGHSGMGKSVASHLQKMGIDVVHVGNAKHFDYQSSIVIYPTEANDSAKTAANLLSQLCGISGPLTRADRQASYPSLIVGKDYNRLLRRLEDSYAKLQ